MRARGVPAEGDVGPVRAEWRGAYLDGKVPVRRPAAVRLLRQGLEIVLEDGTLLRWPYAELRQAQGFSAGEEVRLERKGPLPELLLVAEPGFLASLRRIGPEAARQFRAPRRRRQRWALAALSAVGAVLAGAAVYFWLIPLAADAVAPRVPVAWEERLGRSVADELAPPETRCLDPQVKGALDKIMARLTRSLPAAPYTFRVAVVSRRGVNALAAPGGHILVFQGLLERTRSPEELAGVLAHEIQHVIRRDVTRAILRHVSAGLLLAALTGDPTGAMAYGLEAAHTLASLQYSRDTEAIADAEGLRLLLASRIDPEGMLGFFEQMLAAEPRPGTLVPYFSSHPSATDRLVRLRTMLREAHAEAPVPLLPDADWRTLRLRCSPPAGAVALPPKETKRE